METRFITALIFYSLLTHLTYALYSATSPVKILSSSSYHKVKQGDKPYLIEFFSSSCGHCRAFAPEYELTASALNHVIPVRAIEDQAVLQSERVEGVPTIKLFLGQKASKRFVTYNGPRNAKSLVEFALSEVRKEVLGSLDPSGKSSERKTKKSRVIQLTTDTLDSQVLNDEKANWLIAFTTPSKNETFNNVLESLSKAFEDNNLIKFAKFNIDQKPGFKSRFNIKKLPAIYFFPKGEKNDTSHVEFTDKLDLPTLQNFVQDQFKKTLQAQQLTSQQSMDKECTKKVCVIAILPDLLDTKAKGRLRYIDELNQVVQAAFKLPFTFFWMEGGQNFDFEEALHLQFGYPAVFAIHLEKNKYSIHKGRFEKKDIQLFINSLKSGRQALISLPKNLPSLKNSKPWDGQDPEPINVEQVNKEIPDTPLDKEEDRRTQINEEL